MKKFSASLAVLVLVFLVGCGLWGKKDSEPATRDVPTAARASVMAEPRKRIMVLPFLDTSDRRSVKVAETARNSLVRVLAKSDQFVLLHPAEFTKDVGASLVNGQYDLSSLAKEGKRLGLLALLEGTVVEIKAKKIGDEVGLFRQIKVRMDASVRIRMVAVKNGTEILNQVRTATVESSTTRVGRANVIGDSLEDDPALVNEAVSKAVAGSLTYITRAVSKMSWEGRVALVQGQKIYLNAGRLTGLQVGDLLKVSNPGDDVFDPETGELIGVAPGTMKGTLELVSYFGKDGAIAVVHSGAGFKENDIVEVY